MNEDLSLVLGKKVKSRFDDLMRVGSELPVRVMVSGEKVYERGGNEEKWW